MLAYRFGPPPIATDAFALLAFQPRRSAIPGVAHAGNVRIDSSATDAAKPFAHAGIVSKDNSATDTQTHAAPVTAMLGVTGTRRPMTATSALPPAQQRRAHTQGNRI